MQITQNAADRTGVVDKVKMNGHAQPLGFSGLVGFKNITALAAKYLRNDDDDGRNFGTKNLHCHSTPLCEIFVILFAIG
jgi:hypothetical protein